MTTTLPVQVDTRGQVYQDAFLLGSSLVLPAFGTATSYVSSNGTTWASHAKSYPSGKPPNDVAFVLGSSLISYHYTVPTVTALTSSDGYTWTTLGDASATFPTVSFGVSAGSSAYVFADDGANFYTSSTSNGVTFTALTITNLPYGEYWFLYFGGYLWALPFGHAGTVATAVYKSSNGISWALVTADWGIGNTLGYSTSFAVTGTDMVVFTTADAHPKTYTSSNGATWANAGVTANPFMVQGKMFYLGSAFYLLQDFSIFQYASGITQVAL